MGSAEAWSSYDVIPETVSLLVKKTFPERNFPKEKIGVLFDLVAELRNMYPDQASGPPASREEIEVVEAKLGFTLSPDLRVVSFPFVVLVCFISNFIM